jgi:hypothetical protein
MTNSLHKTHRCSKQGSIRMNTQLERIPFPLIQQAWVLVMERGMTLEEAAVKLQLTRPRLERMLLALAQRRETTCLH